MKKASITEAKNRLSAGVSVVDALIEERRQGR